MKKFLCYDTNDAASGKINVDNRGMLKPNSTVPSGSTSYQQLVTDGTGTAKWEDRLAYEDTYTISWDGNTDGLVSVELAPEYVYYKVSDFVIDRDNLLSFNYTTSNGLHGEGGVNHTVSLGAVWSDDGSEFFQNQDFIY